jgi:hypothetical protein
MAIHDHSPPSRQSGSHGRRPATDCNQPSCAESPRSRSLMTCVDNRHRRSHLCRLSPSLDPSAGRWPYTQPRASHRVATGSDRAPPDSWLAVAASELASAARMTAPARNFRKWRKPPRGRNHRGRVSCWWPSQAAVRREGSGERAAAARVSSPTPPARGRRERRGAFFAGSSCFVHSTRGMCFVYL